MVQWAINGDVLYHKVKSSQATAVLPRGLLLRSYDYQTIRTKTRSHQKSSVDLHHNTLWSEGEMDGPILECDKIINIRSRKLVKVLFCSYL